MSDHSLAEDLVAPRAALKGDLTQGPILRTLVLFSIPALISNFLTTVGGSINAIWVGQLIGEVAVAATANANMIMFLVVGTVFGFSMATSIGVGHAYGAHDIDAARRSMGTGVGFCGGLAILIALVGFFFAEPVLRLMATPPEALPQALAYLRFTFIGMPFASLSMVLAMGVRGAGDATTPMFAMIVSVLIGIVLNPLLIVGTGPFPELGIAGSALAAVIGNVVGTGVMIAMIYYRKLAVRLREKEFRYLIPRRAELSYMLAKGVPMGAQTLLSTSAGVVMIGLVNREGLSAAAAYGASLQLWNYVQLPAMAVGMAISTMVAQNIGARRHDRIGRITKAGMGVALGVTGVLTAVLLLFDRPVLALFLGDSESPAVELARHIMLVCTWSFLLAGVMMVLFSTMRAYGAVVPPLIIMFIGLYPGRIGFYELAYPLIGAEAVWWSYPVGFAICAVLAVLVYRFGNWRRAAHRSLQPAAMVVE